MESSTRSRREATPSFRRRWSTSLLVDQERTVCCSPAAPVPPTTISSSPVLALCERTPHATPRSSSSLRSLRPGAVPERTDLPCLRPLGPRAAEPVLELMLILHRVPDTTRGAAAPERNANLTATPPGGAQGLAVTSATHPGGVGATKIVSRSQEQAAA